MHRFFRLAALWLGGTLGALATPLNFSDTVVTLRSQTGSALASAEAELGTFSDGFVPTALNRSDWSAHWHSTGTGYFVNNAGAVETSADLVVSDNSTLTAGQPVYLWIYTAGEKGLYMDPAWTIPTASPLGLGEIFRFTPQTVAVFGRFDAAQHVATISSSDLDLVAGPVSQQAVPGATVSFSVQATGTGPFTYQWQKDGVDLPGATDATLTLTNISMSDAATYIVVVADPHVSVTSSGATLSLIGAPAFSTQPQSVTVSSGAALTLSAAADGAAPFTFQWFLNNAPIAGATSASYTVAAVSAANAGSYYLEITNALGSTRSALAEVTIDFGSYLSNLSVRASMSAQQNLIVGFVVNGGSKPILVRSAGPALNTTFQLTGYLTDPQLTLHDATGIVATNNDWEASLAATFSSLGAFPFVNGSKDAALLKAVTSANTAHAPAATAGTQLVEVYDAGSNNGPKLVNVSARNYCGTGNDVLIAGFVIAGTGKHTVLIRAVGPGLTYKFGLGGVLADPKLTLYQGGDVIASNDNWDATLATTFSTLGAFDIQNGSKDAALLVELDAGVYTAQVAGADGGQGEALVEIYDATP